MQLTRILDYLDFLTGSLAVGLLNDKARGLAIAVAFAFGFAFTFEGAAFLAGAAFGLCFTAAFFLAGFCLLRLFQKQ